MQTRSSEDTMKHIAAICAILASLIAGCATPTPTQEIDRAVFAGDGLPLVTTRDAFAGVMDNLASHESLVVARAPDGAGAL